MNQSQLKRQNVWNEQQEEGKTNCVRFEEGGSFLWESFLFNPFEQQASDLFYVQVGPGWFVGEHEILWFSCQRCVETQQ